MTDTFVIYGSVALVSIVWIIWGISETLYLKRVSKVWNR